MNRSEVVIFFGGFILRTVSKIRSLSAKYSIKLTILLRRFGISKGCFYQFDSSDSHLGKTTKKVNAIERYLMSIERIINESAIPVAYA